MNSLDALNPLITPEIKNEGNISVNRVQIHNEL